MKVIIVGGGDPPSLNLLREELVNTQYIICADAGANCLFEYGIVPHFLVGDFDSINPDVLTHAEAKAVKIYRHPTDKNNTDTSLATTLAFELGAKEIVLLGCTGSRIDHFLSNLGILLRCGEKSIRASLKDNHMKMSMHHKPCILKSKKGEKFSLQAFGGPVSGLNVVGSKYELSNYHLLPGDDRTIANEFVCEDLAINFQSGNLLIIEYI
jgi:thiamine pyrophosphokinase